MIELDFISKDWDLFQKQIGQEQISSVKSINDIYAHSVSNRGKRLRAIMVIMTAKALGYKGSSHIDLACIVEWLHAATILHDDIIDNASFRSSEASANIVFGNTFTVLGGDFLYGMAFRKIAEIGKNNITLCISQATNTIIEGEILQNETSNNKILDIENYNEVIARKTACLFQVCTDTATILATNNKIPGFNFGYHFGMAYQILDDLLDYLAESKDLGKEKGNDYQEGKITLPIIIALENCSEKLAKEILDQKLDISEVIDIIKNSKAIDFCVAEINQHLSNAKKSLDFIPESSYKSGLISLLNYVKHRAQL